MELIMYHYVYQIRCPITDMKYIGVRSSKCLPEKDTGYWGSSKHLPKDIHLTHVKEIIAIFFTRQDAVLYEVELHNLYDVGVNPMFYNKAKQTCVGFDTGGVKLEGEHLLKTRTNFLGRKHTEAAKKKLSEKLTGRKVSNEAREAMSKSQKALAATPGYVNHRKGIPLSAEAKEKLSKSLKESGHAKGANNVTFTPWFITDVVEGVTWLFYDVTKDEYAAANNLTRGSLHDAIKRSKGHKEIKNGVLKGKILGNIEDAQKPFVKERIARSWYITHPNDFTEVFYYTYIGEYAKEKGIKATQISDAIHISGGKTPMKKGPFKGLILGRINKDIV